MNWNFLNSSIHTSVIFVASHKFIVIGIGIVVIVVSVVVVVCLGKEGIFVATVYNEYGSTVIIIVRKS